MLNSFVLSHFILLIRLIPPSSLPPAQCRLNGSTVQNYAAACKDSLPRTAKALYKKKDQLKKTKKGSKHNQVNETDAVCANIVNRYKSWFIQCSSSRSKLCNARMWRYTRDFFLIFHLNLVDFLPWEHRERTISLIAILSGIYCLWKAYYESYWRDKSALHKGKVVSISTLSAHRNMVRNFSVPVTLLDWYFTRM